MRHVSHVGQSVCAYIIALTDLYGEQKAPDTKSHHPSPCGDNVGEYLKSLRQRNMQHDREKFADKCGDTLLDGYSEEEFGSHACLLRSISL